MVDVGCYSDNFIALTSDGDVHQWTHNIPNPAAGVYNLPSTPVNGQGPTVADKDKLKSISIGVGVCAGVTELGKVHTWRTFMRGGFAGMQGSQKEPLTPLGRDEGAKDTTVASLGKLFQEFWVGQIWVILQTVCAYQEVLTLYSMCSSQLCAAQIDRSGMF